MNVKLRELVKEWKTEEAARTNTDPDAWDYSQQVARSGVFALCADRLEKVLNERRCDTCKRWKPFGSQQVQGWCETQRRIEMADFDESCSEWEEK
jgi:hypothetical protein